MRSDQYIHLGNVARTWSRMVSESSAIIIFSPYVTSKTAITVTSDIEETKCELYTLFNAEVFVNQSSSLRTLKVLKSKGINLYYLPDLHAKLFLTEKEVTIGSQNLTSRGGRKNIETTLRSSNRAVNKKIRNWIENDIIELRIEITNEMLYHMEELIKPLIKEYKIIHKNCLEIDIQIDSDRQKRAKEKLKAERRVKSLINKLVKEVKQNKRNYTLSTRNETIPRDIAVLFIRATAVWLNHPKAWSGVARARN